MTSAIQTTELNNQTYDIINNLDSARRDVIPIIIQATFDVYEASYIACQNSYGFENRHDFHQKGLPFDYHHVLYALKILGENFEPDNIYVNLSRSAQIFLNHKRDYGTFGLNKLPFNLDCVKQFLIEQFTPFTVLTPDFDDDFILFWYSILNPIQITYTKRPSKKSKK